MSRWRLAATGYWLDPTAMAGEARYLVMRFTERGAQTVRTNLTGGDGHGLTPATLELSYQLRWGVL